MFVAWNDLDTSRTLVQPAVPAGATLNTPGGEAPDALERVALTGRLSGKPGVYVGYLKGTNPFSSVPEIWQVGAPASMTIKNNKGARFIGLAPAPSGRIWGFWYVQSPQMTIFAARSNRAVTKFGPPNSLKPPAGATAVYSLEGEGSASGGPLDLLALVQRSGNDIANWHQRVLPRLSLGVSVKNGKVLFTVTDAGEAVERRQGLLRRSQRHDQQQREGDAHRRRRQAQGDRVEVRLHRRAAHRQGLTGAGSPQRSVSNSAAEQNFVSG